MGAKIASQRCEETPTVASSADLGCLAPPYILCIRRVGKVCRRVWSAADLAGFKVWGASRRLTLCTSIEFFTWGFPFGRVCRRYTGVPSAAGPKRHISIRYGMFARAVVHFTDRKPSPRAVGLEGWAFGQ